MRGAATALAVVLMVGVCVLTGCGTANPYSLPNYDPSAGGAPGGAGSLPLAATSSRAAAGPIPGVQRAATPPPEVRYRPADPWGEGSWVERGTIVAGSPEKQAAVDAVAKYLSVWVQLSNTWQVDDQALAAVATGEAINSAHARADRQRKRDWRTIGRFVINVSSVRVTGSHATVTGCHFDATSEVDHRGGIVIAPPGGVRITMEVQRTGGVWRVSHWPDGQISYCDGPL